MARIVTSQDPCKRLSLERAFTLGNELIAASERINDVAGWQSFVVQRGLSARSVRRYIVFARWADEHPEDFAALLRRTWMRIRARVAVSDESNVLFYGLIQIFRRKSRWYDAKLEKWRPSILIVAEHTAPLSSS